jgi:hypothetical protein
MAETSHVSDPTYELRVQGGDLPLSDAAIEAVAKLLIDAALERKEDAQDPCAGQRQ